jgi:hypothetical protein
VERKERNRSIEQSLAIRAHASFDLVIQLVGDFRHHHGIRRLWDVERVKDDEVID